MKNKFIYLLCVMCCASCNVMDTKPFESYSEDLVWSTKATADAFVFQTYAEIINTSKMGVEAWTPNATSYSGWGGDNVSRELIDRYYDAGFDRFGQLRRCNQIIEKSEASTGLSEIQKQELIAEGKMLRALVYYNQALRIGRFVPVNKVLGPNDKEAFNAPLTSSVAESYKIILADVNDAIEGLPEKSESGRLNKWVALAYKSEICLAAAAYTGETSYFDESLKASDEVINSGMYTLDENYGDIFLEKGKDSKEIIFAVYRLSENTTVGSFDELICTVPNCSNDDLVKGNCGPLFKNERGKSFDGWHFYSPTQNLVDDYLVIDQQDGKAKRWDETSQYVKNVADNLSDIHQVGRFTKMPVNVPSDDDMGETSKGAKIIKSGKISGEANITRLMYENRDKRFYGTIVYDSCYWLNEELVTTCCNGNLWGAARSGNGGQPDSWHTTTTGYYWRKAVYDVRPFFGVSQKTDYHMVMLRLGKMYMNKAEALLMKGQVAEAVKALNETRVLHGGLPASTATTLTDAWADYKRERRVELALENDYYWSLLRWGKYGGEANHGKPAGDAIPDLNEPAYKIQITKNRKEFFVGQVTSNYAYDRNFSVKRYLLPIPQGQIDKRSASGIRDEQNPLW